MPSFATPPPQSAGVKISFPAEHILLVTIDREKQMNSISMPLHWQMYKLFHWFDHEPELRVAIITGTGPKAFCAGQDLIELGKNHDKQDEPWLRQFPPGGFAGLSRRLGKKPVIAAVNGYALGGGMEIVLNCDMVVAAPHARFGLPEALRGIYAAAGGLPRLIRICGLQVATEIALTGRQLSAEEALRYNIINKISKTPASLINETLELAQKIGQLSPDAVVVTRQALREAWETASVERAFQISDERYREALHAGENAKEGLAAFAEKRKPSWKPSKL